jgi:hypothetical protein
VDKGIAEGERRNSFTAVSIQQQRAHHRKRMGDQDTENMPSTVREYVATDLCEMAMAGKKKMPLHGFPVDCVAAQVQSGEPEC